MCIKLNTYYEFHHSEKDTLQKSNIKELPLVPRSSDVKYANNALTKILKPDTVLRELDWHGQQSVYFEYSLKGSSKAYKDILGMCRN